MKYLYQQLLAFLVPYSFDSRIDRHIFYQHQ